MFLQNTNCTVHKYLLTLQKDELIQLELTDSYSSLTSLNF